MELVILSLCQICRLRRFNKRDKSNFVFEMSRETTATLQVKSQWKIDATAYPDVSP